jgi:CheY-like chemotaxis protein
MGTRQAPRGYVLVVDDVPALAKLMVDILATAGYRTITAANGQEALAHLRSGVPLPALILLDLDMPVMNGWEFRAEQQRDPFLNAIPVLIVSGEGNLHQHASAMGAAGYLNKPVALSHLLNTVSYFIPRVPTPAPAD